MPASTHHQGTRHSISSPLVVELVRLPVAVVVVVLAHRDDDVHRRARDPRLERRAHVVRLVGELGDPAAHPASVTTTKRAPWLKPAARRLPAARDDPLDRLAVDRLVGVVPHHPPALENVGKLHDAHDDGYDTDGRRPGPVDGRAGAARLPRRRAVVARPRPLRLPPRARASRSSSSTRSRLRASAASRCGSSTTPTSAAPIPVPPPPKLAPEDIARLGVPTKPIAGIPDLMHHKYVVRDRASVWTGSTNWTDDSWSREENVIAVVDSPELARAYTLDFEQLWDVGIVEEAGRVEPRPVHVDGIEIRPWFCPGYGDALSHRIAKCDRPREAARADLLAGDHGGAGARDARAGDRRRQGRRRRRRRHDAGRGRAAPVGPDRRARRGSCRSCSSVIGSGRFAGKRSTPWGPGTVHDYMHAKITVADDVVFLGSFNLSHSGEMNAENVLEIHDPALAERLAGFVDGVRARYPVASLTRPASRRASTQGSLWQPSGGEARRSSGGVRECPTCALVRARSPPGRTASNCSLVSQTSTTRMPSSVSATQWKRRAGRRSASSRRRGSSAS